MRLCQALLSATISAFALVACQQADPDNISIDESNVMANAEMETLPPSEDATPGVSDNVTNEADDSGSEPKATLIPAAFQGRWGMVPADCTSTRGDAKGLIVVSDDKIRFYESTAKLGKVTTSAAENLTANFDFTGEGQSWSKSVNLRLSNSSNTLTRSDDEGRYSYSRCKA